MGELAFMAADSLVCQHNRIVSRKVVSGARKVVQGGKKSLVGGIVKENSASLAR